MAVVNKPELAKLGDVGDFPRTRKPKPMFIIRRLYGAPVILPEAGARPHFHRELWSMLSDHEWLEWEDLLAMAVTPNQPNPTEDRRLNVQSEATGRPPCICFRRLHVFSDYGMLDSTESAHVDMAPRWRSYRESLWAHLNVSVLPGLRTEDSELTRILFLLRQGSRELVNHRVIASMLHSHGFEVRSIKPDKHSVSVVACAVVQVSLLIGTNSGSYNAVFLQSGGGVLELAPHASEFYLYPRLPDAIAEQEGSRVNSWQIGFERLGVHQLVYACADLFAAYKCASDSSPNADMAKPCKQLVRNPEMRPIVVSPKSILRLLGELRLAIQDSRESEIMTMGSMPVGSTVVRNCFPWENGNVTVI